MSIATDEQLLEPGSEVRLFDLDCTEFGGDLLRFHGHLQQGPIYWQGNAYQPWPLEAAGFEQRGDGRASAPTLSVGNVDGSISALCLYFDDLVGAKLTVRETFAHYLDGANFGGGNAQADPTQERINIWFIEQKTGEDNITVTWQLSAPPDFQGQQIPARQITGLCQWCITGGYRGADCGYTGTAMFDEEGNPTDDPSKDRCSGLLSTGCKPRFGPNNPLPFGGFPASGLIKM